MENVELDHADLRTEIFRRQMAKWGQTIEPKKEEDQQPIVEEKVVEMAVESISATTVIQGGDFE
jgi:hypothetical protein